jgi:hypothetical protein
MLRTAGRISPIAARTSSEPMAFTAMRLLPALDAQLRRDSSINHFEYQVLAALSEAPELTLRMSDLAVLSEGSLSRLSQVVARLEEKNWVRRTPDPPTAATPWRSSPTTVGTRSSPPPPATSTKFADSSSTHSPTPSSTSSQISGNGSCAPSTPPTAVSPTAAHSCSTKDAEPRPLPSSTGCWT